MSIPLRAPSRSPNWKSENPAEAAWLESYKGGSHFLLSLQRDLRKYGALTPNQTVRVRENMAEETARAPQLPLFPQQKPLQIIRPRPAPTFTVAPGDVIEVKAWVAKRIALECKVPVVFRNLEIVEVLRESQKAYQVRVRFSSKIANSCHVCGQELDTEISRACGIGPVCAVKLGFKRPKVGDAASVLALLDKLAETIGVLGPVWIPKSLIVDTARIGSAPVVGTCIADEPVSFEEDIESLEVEMDRQYAKHEQQQEQAAFLRKEEERDRMGRN